jgi:ABC-type uncharacterized transport system auxiliary subunit
VTRLSPRRKAVPPGQRIGRADFQLLIDVRRFQIETDSHPTAHISLSARILDKNGKVIASRLFEQSEKFDRLEPQAAVLAFNGAFDRLAKDFVAWTVQTWQSVRAALCPDHRLWQLFGPECPPELPLD